MRSYSTVQEKATEWDVSIRHVQYLCRKGGLDGAIKRAGTWFIPKDAPPPLKSNRNGDRKLRFVGTKKKVFNSSIQLFTTRGFDVTSIKDIAVAVGISQSAVYNHFKTKQEILDNIYDYYVYYYFQRRPCLKDIEPTIVSGTLIDLMTCIMYEFDEDYDQDLRDITKLILQRNSFDDRAREITKTLILEERIKFLEDVFRRAVEMGRLEPFDTHSMSTFVNSIKLARLYIWLADPDSETAFGIAKSELRLYQYAASFLTDLKPANKIGAFP